MTAAFDQSHRYRYAAVAIALHWTIAVLIIAQIAAGLWMSSGDGAASAGPGTLRFAVFQLHKSFGILVLLLSVARVAWRLFNPPPSTHVVVLPWEKALSTAVYAAFYILMIALPLTGWALVSSSPTGIPTLLFGVLEWPHLPLPATEVVEDGFHEVHEVLAFVAIALIALHVAGALKHHLVDRENLIIRMAPGLFGRTEAPPTRARAVPLVVGAPVALALVVLAAPVVAGMGSGSSVGALAQASSGGPSGWAVDPAASSIVFSGAQSGTAFEGRFETWTAEIVFDPADPGSAHVLATVDTTSVATDNAYVRGSIQSQSWLDTRNHPQATFEVSGFTSTGPGAYEAAGTLTLRGVAQPLTLPFTLTIDGDKAHAVGSVALDRRAFQIGTDTATNDGAVSPEITVTVTVEASRADAA